MPIPQRYDLHRLVCVVKKYCFTPACHWVERACRSTIYCVLRRRICLQFQIQSTDIKAIKVHRRWPLGYLLKGTLANETA